MLHIWYVYDMWCKLNPNTVIRLQYHRSIVCPWAMAHVTEWHCPPASSVADHKSFPALGMACFPRCARRKHLDGTVLGWELLWAGKLHKALTWLMSHEQPCKEQTAKPDPWTDVQVRCPVCRKYIGKGLLFSQCAQEYQFVEILGEMGERVHRHLVDRCFAQCQPYLQ